MKGHYPRRLAVAVLAGAGTMFLPGTAVLPGTANAQLVRSTTVRHNEATGRTVVIDRGPARTRAVVVDRSRPGWWRGNPAFVGYAGPRAGYYFAPGHGYYAVPRGYYGRPFVAGAVIPVPMRRYVVVQPAMYGLAPAPVGYGWYYAGTSLVLASIATGVIVQSIAGGW